MRAPRTLQAQLSLGIGLLISILWIGAASATAVLLRHEMDEVFDSALQETAQRLLPLAILDIVGREEEGVTQHLAAISAHEELFFYVVRDRAGRILLQSHSTDPSVFPPYDGPGFRQTDTHRFYGDEALQGSVSVSIAEPLDHRREVFRGILLGLGLPLFGVVPLSLIGVAFVLQRSLAPLRRLRDALASRGLRDLSPVTTDDQPGEVQPVARTLNDLLDRLKAAFEAERSFASNVAHELRTPLAGAIAQAQRLRAETEDTAARQRAGEIEATLKRLTRLSERMMQLARAEGGRLRADQPNDLRPVLHLIVDEIGRTMPDARLDVSAPDGPVLSDIDLDAFGILCRNLIENALRHGSAGAEVAVTLSTDGRLEVANKAPVVPPETLARLTDRFERTQVSGDGSGLGLAIVATIVERVGGRLVLTSPIEGRQDGFLATVHLPAHNAQGRPGT